MAAVRAQAAPRDPIGRSRFELCCTRVAAAIALILAIAGIVAYFAGP